MAYTTNVINLPLSGGPSCKEQHEAYAVEKKRLEVLAAKLGPVAADCHKAHGEYESAAAKRAAAQEVLGACQAKHSVWRENKAKREAYLTFKKKCVAYQDAKKAHRDLVAKRLKANAEKKAAWEATVLDLRHKNYVLGEQYKGAQMTYLRDLSFWETKSAAYLDYMRAVAIQNADLSRTVSQRTSSVTSLANVRWPLRTMRCGSKSQCVSRRWRENNQNTCVVIKGVGATGLGATTRDATTCEYFHYYPTCPPCPSNKVPHPGDKPTAPTEPAYHTIPSEPSYKHIPTLEEYLTNKGLDPMPGCGKIPEVPPPGNKPTCDPTEKLPPTPNKPDCIPPDIPAIPPAPTCNPSLLSQIGPMWLLLAAGAGGLYWYAKKK